MKTIVKDIIKYIEFLRSKDYMIMVSCLDDCFAPCMEELIKYEVHLPSICSYLKSSSDTFKMCVHNKSVLKDNPPEVIKYCSCYAGVEEYVVPIQYKSKCILCLNISGFRGVLEKSKESAKKISELCDDRFDNYYNSLSTNPPKVDDIIALTSPLQYMFISLYDECQKNPNIKTPAEVMYNTAIRFIYENYQQNITLKDIADFVNFSESHLRHTFLKMSGMTVNNYIKNVRLDKAVDLLKYTNLSITQIAYDCGFSDSNYFSTVFSKTYKLSPKDFRKENR